MVLSWRSSLRSLLLRSLSSCGITCCLSFGSTDLFWVLGYLLPRSSGQGCPGLGLLVGIRPQALREGKEVECGHLVSFFPVCRLRQLPGSVSPGLSSACPVGSGRRASSQAPRSLGSPSILPCSYGPHLSADGIFPASALPSLDAALQPPFHCAAPTAGTISFLFEVDSAALWRSQLVM